MKHRPAILVTELSRQKVPGIGVPPVERSRNGKLTRRGSLVVEMVVCAIMLAAVSAVLVPAIHGAGQQRKAIRFETLAMIELGNIRQQLAARAEAPETTPEQPDLSAWFRLRFPRATLTIKPEPGEGDPSELPMNAVRLTIQTPVGASRPDWVASVLTWFPVPDSISVQPPQNNDATPADESKPTEDAK